MKQGFAGNVFSISLIDFRQMKVGWARGTRNQIGMA